MWNSLGESSPSRAEPGARSGRTLEVRFETAAPVFHGVHDDERGVVFIDHRLADPHERAATIAHEVGHAFGLFHISSRPSVMNPKNLVVEPNREDAADRIALWGECPGGS